MQAATTLAAYFNLAEATTAGGTAGAAAIGIAVIETTITYSTVTGFRIKNYLSSIASFNGLSTPDKITLIVESGFGVPASVTEIVNKHLRYK